MKRILLASLLTLASLTSFAEEVDLFECHPEAEKAAKAIDKINFGDSYADPDSEFSTLVTDKKQTEEKAIIEVSFDDVSNRTYVVKLIKNREALLDSLTGMVQEGLQCQVKSVKQQ